MKVILIVCSIITLAVAAPANDVQLLSYKNENDGSGNYKYSIKQSDETYQQQEGFLKNAGSKDVSSVVKGFYSWVAPNGVVYLVRYQADENGFRPVIEETPPGEEAPGTSAALTASLLGAG